MCQENAKLRQYVAGQQASSPEAALDKKADFLTRAAANGSPVSRNRSATAVASRGDGPPQNAHSFFEDAMAQLAASDSAA